MPHLALVAVGTQVAAVGTAVDTAAAVAGTAAAVVGMVQQTQVVRTVEEPPPV